MEANNVRTDTTKSGKPTFQNPTRYIKCPNCNREDFAVSHLEAGAKTAWYCDDCGVRFRVHVLSPDCADCEVMPGESRAWRCVTLRSAGPVTLKVKGFILLPHKGADGGERFYYDEYTCPTNYLGDVVKVIDEAGEEDPHGVFAFVSSEPWSEADHGTN